MQTDELVRVCIQILLDILGSVMLLALLSLRQQYASHITPLGEVFNRRQGHSGANSPLHVKTWQGTFFGPETVIT